jgi:hypothetical protein
MMFGNHAFHQDILSPSEEDFTGNPCPYMPPSYNVKVS